MTEMLDIKSAQGDYKVHFYQFMTDAIESMDTYQPTHFIADRNVYELYKADIDLARSEKPIYLIDATEEAKTLEGVTQFSTWLQKQGANRSSVIVAIGGGITQDLTAFTAHSYYRGIPWIFFPTTLLSMCDSSIGAKCGINLNEYKNQLGVFQSPRAIFTCSHFLSTLPDFHISSGYGEILKLYLTDFDWQLLDKLENALKDGLRNSELLKLIRKSLEIKKKVIEEDEYESSRRRVLNYGHTFGHSLEAMTNHEIPHGLAVAWGLDLINFIAVERGFLSKEKYLRIKNVIRRNLPFELKTKITARSLVDGARKDKKTDASGINLIFLMDSGNLEIKKVDFDELLSGNIRKYLESENVYELP